MHFGTVGTRTLSVVFIRSMTITSHSIALIYVTRKKYLHVLDDRQKLMCKVCLKAGDRSIRAFEPLLPCTRAAPWQITINLQLIW